MKKILSSFAVFGCFMAIPAAAVAEENGFYLDLSAGSLQLDFSDASLGAGAGGVPRLDFERTQMVGIAAGYSIGVWALELEYLQGLGDSKLEASNANGQISGSFDYREYRISGVYRSPGQLYFLGKVGLSFPDLDSGLPLRMGDSAIYGLGGGYRISDSTAVELELNQSQDDTTAYSLGIRHRF